VQSQQHGIQLGLIGPGWACCFVATGTVAAAAAAEQNGAVTVHAGSETAARVVTVTARVTAAVTGASLAQP
jgi:hypothetical protein